MFADALASSDAVFRVVGRPWARSRTSYPEAGVLEVSSYGNFNVLQVGPLMFPLTPNGRSRRLTLPSS